jgi:hypothetical protein
VCFVKCSLGKGETMKINSNQVQSFEQILAKIYTPIEFDFSSKGSIFDIIHIYPEESCIGEDGSLNGYRDAMLFSVKLFDTNKKTVVSPPKNYDMIEVLTQTKFETKVFCDGSYLMKFRMPMRFNGLFQAASISDI